MRLSVCPLVYLFSRGTRPEPPGSLREKLGSAAGTRSLCPGVSGCEWLSASPLGVGGRGGGGCLSTLPPTPRPYNLLPRSLSDSLGLGAGARLSRCLLPTLPSGRLLPERCGPGAGRSPRRPPSPGGSPRRSSSPEPVSLEPEPRGARARRTAAASPGSRDSGNGVSRPGGRSRGWVGRLAAGRWRVFTCLTGAARPRSPDTAGLLCPDPDVWRVLGGREYRVAFPLRGERLGAVRSLERMRSGGGEILQGPRRWGSFGSADCTSPCTPTLTPVALGLEVRWGRPAAAHHPRGKARRGPREAGISSPHASPGTGSRGSWRRYRWGKLPRGRRFQGPVFT